MSPVPVECTHVYVTLFFLTGSVHDQLAGVVLKRGHRQPDHAAEARPAGPLQPAAAPESLPLQLPRGLQQLQPSSFLELRMPYG